MAELEIHWAKPVEIVSEFNEDTDEVEQGFILNDEFWSLSEFMITKDDYFHGVMGISNTGCFMVRLSDCGELAVVACVS